MCVPVVMLVQLLFKWWLCAIVLFRLHKTTLSIILCISHRRCCCHCRYCCIGMLKTKQLLVTTTTLLLVLMVYSKWSTWIKLSIFFVNVYVSVCVVVYIYMCVYECVYIFSLHLHAIRLNPLLQILVVWCLMPFAVP